MSEFLFTEPTVIDEIEWADLIRDINKKRCVLFLGPTLPVYLVGTEKLDFYSKASLHLASIFLENKISFDAPQSANLLYTARKFLNWKNNMRLRLDDEIGKIYATEYEKIRRGVVSALPDIYKNIAKLPWDSIVNTQPDQFLEYAFKKKINFHYYHYKNQPKSCIKELDADSLLVYNLFGALINENDDYRSESLVLTEEDQVDFIRNVIKENPPIPESVTSRFDENKRYIFLDFNLENWHFRLLIEALKLKKTFSPISPQHLKIHFSSYTKDFYKNRYGFLFIKNNSEEFLQELVQKYDEKYPLELGPNLLKRKLFIAYHDEDENSSLQLIKHLDPWVQKGALNIWCRAVNLIASERLEKEKEAFEMSDCIILMISADILNGDYYENYIKPALNKTTNEGTTKVIAVIARECAWTETDVDKLTHIIPSNGKAINTNNGQDLDEKYKLTATAIAKILW